MTLGVVTERTTGTEPNHVVEFREGHEFPTFRARSPRAKCTDAQHKRQNGREAETTYAASFVGHRFSACFDSTAHIKCSNKRICVFT